MKVTVYRLDGTILIEQSQLTYAESNKLFTEWSEKYPFLRVVQAAI